MKKLILRTSWILALFVTGLIAGCSAKTSAPPNPTVLSTTPARGAINAPLAQVITATFSKAMNLTTITNTTFTLTSPGGVSVLGTVTSAGTTSSFTPTLPLILGTVYTATVTTGVQDTLGHALLANMVWTFTTGTIPTVMSTNPATNAITIPLNQKIAATFNQAMNPATLTAAGTFGVAIAGGGLAVPEPSRTSRRPIQCCSRPPPTSRRALATPRQLLPQRKASAATCSPVTCGVLRREPM